MKFLPRLCLVGIVAFTFSTYAQQQPVSIGTYGQEVATFYPLSDTIPLTSAHRIKIGDDGSVVAETTGLWKELSEGQWIPATPKALEVVERFTNARQIAISHVMTYQQDNSIDSARIYQFATTAGGDTYIATDVGLLKGSGSQVEKVVPIDPQGLVWGDSDVRGVTIDPQGRLWFASRAGVACQDGDKWTFYTAADGLPYNQFTCVAAGGDGSVWFGTTIGAIRFKDGEWAYRQGKRWLPGDHVNDIAVDADGNAWFATKGGVGVIERREMTLAAKADHYETEVEQYIKRTPYGYTSEVSLSKPGDKSEIRYHDSDNDGLWTAMYGAGECFAYGATGDANAKRRAKEAFEALRFLQKVTQGGEHSPPHGYVARTIRSTDGPDPNIGRIERDRISRETNDHLWKAYEPRWPKSADGKWYWKSDTSSDELDGHYFFYPLYYDLVADSRAEKARVREVVRDLTDHLVEHDFMLIDLDGTVTRWGMFNPDHLNHDNAWHTERGLNSLSMLSYLAVAEYVTGDKKYAKASRYLIDEHAYDANLMHPKVQYGFGSGNQSDDEMAFMSFYNLIKYTKDEALREKAQYAFHKYWRMEFPEMNPFFNFSLAASNIGATFEDPWGSHRVGPRLGWLSDSIATLKGFPLDRLNWAHQNSHRLDIIPLGGFQSQDPDASDRRRRGYRVNGKVLPIEERFFHHWNTDPWTLDYGGNGASLASGTVFLLPYYMGLYHGFIE